MLPADAGVAGDATTAIFGVRGDDPSNVLWLRRTVAVSGVGVPESSLSVPPKEIFPRGM
jgi:hypothetical protein